MNIEIKIGPLLDGGHAIAVIFEGEEILLCKVSAPPTEEELKIIRADLLLGMKTAVRSHLVGLGVRMRNPLCAAIADKLGLR
jgi:hypothetical protein